MTMYYHPLLLFANFIGFLLNNAFTLKLLPYPTLLSNPDHPPTFYRLLTLIILADLFALPYSICYTFLLPPRLLVAKLSGLQLQRFGILCHKTSCYYLAIGSFKRK